MATAKEIKKLIKDLQISITAAKKGAPYPVGTPIPVIEVSKDIDSEQKSKK